MWYNKEGDENGYEKRVAAEETSSAQALRLWFCRGVFHNHVYARQEMYSLSCCRAGLAPAVTNHIEYTLWGEIAEQQLFSLKDRFPSVTVRRYVIMPNHIHVILILGNETAGASPRPTVMDVICAYKSLTAQECKKNGFVGKLFQTSFHDHVIRSRRDYEEISQYMQDNPRLWREDCFYTEE